MVPSLAGCSAQDLANLQQARDQTAAALQQAQADQQQIQHQLATRPANDPLRHQLEPQLQKLEDIITKAQAALPQLDAAIKSVRSGQPVDPSVQQAVSAIPYGSLALAAASLIFGVVKHVQAGNLVDQQEQTQKAFEQVVAALDAAFPNPTPEQQAKLSGVLDSDVKARVAVARAA